MKKITAIIFAVLIAFFYQGLHASEKLKVAASFYPLAHFAEQAGGKHVEVVNIMPPGAEPHEYEPTPRDIRTIYESDIFIFNGLGLDSWAEKIYADLLKKKIKAVKITEHFHIPGQGEKDPHVWLDPLLAQKEVEIIRDIFIASDPANADSYKTNSASYINDLQRLHEKYSTGLNSCKNREIVVTHDAFSYLARRYNITAYSIMGISPEEEPSPRKIAELSRLARDKQIRYIFFESLVSPKIAKTIAHEVNAEVLVLNPLGGLTVNEIKQGRTYISVMEENLENLRTALSCK